MILLNGQEVQFETFPNGETKVLNIIKATEEQPAYDFFKRNFRHDGNFITFKFENDADFLKLMFVMKHLDTIAFVPCTLFIEYMPYSRMDRSEDGSVFTLKYITQMINSLAFDKVYVAEPHSDVTTALLDRCTPLWTSQALLDSVFNEVQFDLEKDFVIYPDAGAQKRYAKAFGGNVLVAHKERDFETGHIKKLEIIGGDYIPADAKAIIVDDLCSKGGTFLLTAQNLKERGFKEIYLVVTHAEDTIFAGDMFAENSPIDKVFCTDSIISKDWLVWTKAQYKDRLDITPLSELITDVN